MGSADNKQIRASVRRRQDAPPVAANRTRNSAVSGEFASMTLGVIGLVRRSLRVLTGPVDPLAVHTDPRVGGSRIADAVNLAIMTALR